MPVCSYLVHPRLNYASSVIEELISLPGCFAQKADNQDLIILVTESDTKEEEALLQESLKQVKNIECLALSFGQVAEQTQEA